MRVAYTSDIEPGPCAIESYHAHGDDCPNLGDITRIDFGDLPDTDVVVGGSPCFPAGSLVLTDRGFTPIEQVRVGDLALTHLGNWKRVIDTGSHIGDTIMLKGQGTPGIECTPNHKFLAGHRYRGPWDNGKRAYPTMFMEDGWIPAADMTGRMWLNMGGSVPALPIPDFDFTGCRTRDIRLSAPFFYFVGRWLGDGWLNVFKTHGPQGLLHETRVRLRLVRQGGRSASPAGRDRTAFRSQARAYGRALLLLLDRAPRLAGIEFRQGGGEQDDPRMGVRHETRMARGPAPGLLGFRRRPDEKRHARHIGQQTPPARRQDARRRAWQPIRPEHARAQQGAMRHRGTDRAREDQLHARHIRSPAQEHHDRARLLGSCARNRGGTRKGARLQHHRRGRSQLHDRRDRRQELPIPVPGGPACGHA